METRSSTTFGDSKSNLRFEIEPKAQNLSNAVSDSVPRTGESGSPSNARKQYQRKRPSLAQSRLTAPTILAAQRFVLEMGLTSCKE
jgi:hypothetical protein